MKSKKINKFREFAGNNGMILVLIVLMGFMSLLSDKFLSTRNLVNLAIQN